MVDPEYRQGDYKLLLVCSAAVGATTVGGAVLFAPVYGAWYVGTRFGALWGAFAMGALLALPLGVAAFLATLKRLDF